jgi:hypothetical protein
MSRGTPSARMCDFTVLRKSCGVKRRTAGSLEEMLIALRDDRHLLDDPEGLLSARSRKGAERQPRAAQDRESLHPGGFTAARFIEVIEEELVWASG